MKVAIVNDSVMAVECLRRVLQSCANCTIAWIANDGAEAVWRCGNDTPDLILMDLIMPVMDGVEATKRIMDASPCAIVVVTATVSGNASKVFTAMGYGALDAVNTPVLGMSGDAEGKNELLAKIATIQRLIEQKKCASEPVKPVPVQSSRHFGRGGPLVVIGASSGGPHALARVLSALPADFIAPVVVVQHVDPLFATELGHWLNKQCPLNVRMAEEGDSLVVGDVLVAKGGEHLYMSRTMCMTYSVVPEEAAYCPSVDLFFDSVADYWRGDLIGVLLTGMGRDGAKGLLNLKNSGASTIAQDEASCAVYGMPRAAAQLNAAEQILSIGDIGPALVDHFSRNMGASKVL